jgi:CubicO group peptidase (beta-lactamase class C family)
VDRRAFLRLGAGAGAAAAGIALAGTGAGWAGDALAGPRSAAAPGDRPPPYFPPAQGDWETADPAAVGWDPVALERALDFAGRRRSTAVVALQDGRIVAERYWAGADAATVRGVASVQKSVTSVLVGIACGAGSLQVGSTVTDVLGAGWSRASAPHERAVTVEHLMCMTSGLGEQLEAVSPPGRRWDYVNTPYHQLHPVLSRATGVPLEDYADQVLFGPLGITSAAWPLRPASGAQGGPLVKGLEMTARDMARFGLATQSGGRWGDAQVVDEAYLRRSQEPSQQLNPAYGWLWWLNGQSSFLAPSTGQERYDGPLVPDAPQDMTGALGSGDQRVYVVPSLGVVVVRQGETGAPRGTEPFTFDRQWWELLHRAVPRAHAG